MSTDLGPLPEPAAFRVRLASEESGMRHVYAEKDRLLAYLQAPVETLFTADQLRAYAAAEVARERERWEAALRMTWRGTDPLHPAGQPGSYARGSHNGYVGALEGLRENLKIATKDET